MSAGSSTDDEEPFPGFVRAVSLAEERGMSKEEAIRKAMQNRTYRDVEVFAAMYAPSLGMTKIQFIRAAWLR